MHPEIPELWQHLHRTLPPSFAYGVFALVALALGALLLLPTALILGSGAATVWQGYKRDRAGLRARRLGGAAAMELLLRQTVLHLELVNRLVGHAAVPLAVAVVMVQFAVVVLRYVFAIGSIQMQESIWYMHALLFMLGAGYAWLTNAHVRVDVVYAQRGQRYRSLVDLLGAVLLVLPLCAATAWFAWGYVANAWSVREGSTEVSGLPYLYLLKSIILVFALLIALEGLATVIRSSLALGDAKHRCPGGTP